ncbi:MAG: type effector Hrp-dependent outer [Symbiobacteriaceae bacterium]|nr:type effector Hrp-dependent outer [Symbiobacteriaceae bacterium]
MRTIAIISDDLTGAADTGIQFVYAGLKALVLLDPQAGALPQADVIVGVTESRHDAPELARTKVTEWARLLADCQPGEVYKKIDSTLRGNLGAELDATLLQFPGRLAVFAPAFPAAGRTTLGGRHYMHGMPLEETEVARDPTTPVRDSHITRLLATQTDRRMGKITLAALEAGTDTLARVLRSHVAAGTEILISDACTDDHLAALVAGVRALGLPVIWTGSAGLARQLAQARPNPRTAGHSTPPDATQPAGQPMLTIAGSVSGTLRRQINHYCATTGAACITADSDALTGPMAIANAEVARVAAEALCHLQSGRSTVITTSIVPGAMQNPGPAMVQTARTISDRLGSVARRILTEGWSGPLVLSGGDTALAVCRLLGATAIRLRTEPLPGLALGTLVGGPYEDLTVITKAGSFGEEDVLCQISSRLSPSAWATRPVSAQK